MSAFEFVNHESYPEDQYVAESCTLCFDGKYRVTYLRKKMQNGGMFWAEISAAVKHHGEKKYLKGFSQDSNFLQEDIKAFLEDRSWERRTSANPVYATQTVHAVGAGGPSSTQKPNDDDVPF